MSAIETAQRQKAINQLNALDTDTLVDLGNLAANPKAVQKFKSNRKMIKTFIGI